MNTKSQTILWLFNKSPPLFNEPGNQCFTGPYPPTGQQILFQYYGYHNYLQETSKLRSSCKEAIRFVVGDLQNWWMKTGIPLKAWQSIAKMISNNVDEFIVRKKKRGRTTDAEERKRKDFLDKMDMTFWVVQPEFEKEISQSVDWRAREDWEYLELVRGSNRVATLGSRDVKLAARYERNLKEQESETARRAKNLCTISTCDTEIQIIDGEGDVEQDNVGEDEDYTASTSGPPPPKARKLEGVSNDACLVADKYGMSNRAVTQLVAAVHKSDGMNLNNYNISVNTTGRR